MAHKQNKKNNAHKHLFIEFINQGEIIQEIERPYIFEHFFRGKNSVGKKGFGLGLVLTNKIVRLYKGDIIYESTTGTTNIFKLKFPLS